MNRYLILTPGMTGADGVAALSRLVVRAVPQTPAGNVDVLSLLDTSPPALGGDAPRMAFVGAGGSKVQLGACALRAAARASPDTHVICIHLHLAPLALPFLWRRARLTTILCGIEAWQEAGCLRASALRRSETLMAISAHTARRFHEANPAFAARTVQVCHPAAADDEGLREERQQTARKESSPTALIVGRMAAAERYKGHDLLLDLWPQVLAQIADARLIVAGEGDDRRRLESRATALQLHDHVRFVGGVSDAVLGELYRTCTFFVMPSRDEGFGLVFLEAMRVGKACIGGHGAAAEIIQDRVTGLVVDPQQPEQLLAALLRLFQDVETRERMGRAATERWARLFTEERFRERFRGVLGVPSETALCAG